MFEVDKDGLANLLERRGKFFALAELISNAWDSGTPRVEVKLEPIAGQPYAALSVEDWGDGFENLADAYTIFGKSTRGDNPTKRGRFGLGEKLVLACTRTASIITTVGGVRFENGKRSVMRSTRERGTIFAAEIKMTRDEYADVCVEVKRMVPPMPTTFNGQSLHQPELVARFTAKLPTEIADADGILRRSTRHADIEVYRDETDPGQILELGIPIVETSNGYRVNILQKVPLNMERDNVQPSYLRAIEALLLNHVADKLNSEEAAQPWAQEAAGDSRATPEAVKAVVVARFGDRAVVATPNDPMANAQAAANGFTVIAGGSLPSGTWANVRKHGLLMPASQAFPSMTPEQRAAAAQANAGKCPMCGK